MMNKWRLGLSLVVCLVVLGSLLFTRLQEQAGYPQEGVSISVRQGQHGTDWQITLYDQGEHQWQASGEDYRVRVQRLGADVFDLDIQYRIDNQQRHVQQRVRLEPGVTMLAAFAAGPSLARPQRLLINWQRINDQ